MFGIGIPTLLATGVYIAHQLWILTTNRLINRWVNAEYGPGTTRNPKQLVAELKIPPRYMKSVAWCGFTSVVLSGLLFSATAMIYDSVSSVFFVVTLVNIIVGLYGYSIGSSYVKKYVEREIAQNSTSSRQ